MHHHTHLASTVGTSLALNFKGLEDSGFDVWLSQQPAKDQERFRESRNVIESALAAFRAGRWEDVGKNLAKISRCRLSGAEIASIESLDAEDGLERIESIHLLHTPTEDGHGCAQIILSYLVARWNKWPVLHEITGLDHRNEEKFRTLGLRNLVAGFAKIYTGAGAKRMVIDATGGYKPQIAIAVVFGQIFDVPVMYRFESFRHKIWLPPLPVKPDLSVVAENLDFLEENEIPACRLRERFGKILTESNSDFAAFRVCLDEPPINIDREDYYPVSAFGTMMLKRWLATTPASAPKLPDSGKEISVDWGDHHWPKGVQEFAAKLARKTPWISRIETRSGEGLSHGEGIRFRLQNTREKNPCDIECIWVKRDNFPVRLVLKTTAENRRQQENALHFLQEEWGE